MTDDELHELAAWERRQGSYAFERHEHRHTTRRRELLPGCGCVIDTREPYRYGVAKVVGVARLVQTYACDHHMRDDHRY